MSQDEKTNPSAVVKANFVFYLKEPFNLYVYGFKLILGFLVTSSKVEGFKQ